MTLDHGEVRLWADHGAQWRETLPAAWRSLLTLSKGAWKMIDRQYEHLRLVLLVIAALAASAVITGSAILPGAVGLGGTVRYLA